jgi:hypothetical protein
MTDFLIAFVLTFLAGVAIGPLSAAVTSWCNKRFPPLTYSYGSDPGVPYPKAQLLRIAVFCMFLVLGSFIAVIFLLILALIGLIPDVRSLLIATNAVFLGTGALYIAIASMIRCPKCTRHLLIQWTDRPQYVEKTKLGAEGGTAILLKAAMNHDFRCMECGQSFCLKPKDSRSAANA